MVWAILLVATTASAAPPDPPQDSSDIPGLTIRLTADHATGEVLVNGIPATSFAPKPDTLLGDGAGRLTDWLINGENEILVRVRAITTRPPEVVVSILDANDPRKVVIADKIIGAGDRIYRVAMKGLPAWSWTKAMAWTGDDGELRAAVTALHNAYVERNGAKVRSLQGGLIADITETSGPPSAEDNREFDQNVRRMVVAPLATPLTIESFAGGRLWRVLGPDGEGPIRLSQKVGGETIEWSEGSFWARLGGGWQMVR